MFFSRDRTAHLVLLELKLRCCNELGQSIRSGSLSVTSALRCSLRGLETRGDPHPCLLVNLPQPGIGLVMLVPPMGAAFPGELFVLLEVKVGFCNLLGHSYLLEVGPAEPLPRTLDHLATSFVASLHIIVGWNGWVLRFPGHRLGKLRRRQASELLLRLVIAA